MLGISHQSFQPAFSTLAKALLGLIFLLLANRAAIVERLRAKHRDQWTSLGSPKVFGGDRKASLNLLRFIGLRGAAREQGDQLLSILVYVHWVSVVSVALIVIATILLGILSNLQE